MIAARMPELTKRQLEVLLFIQVYQEKHHYSPSVRQLSEYIGGRFKHSSLCHLRALAKKGFVRVCKNRRRAIDLNYRLPALPLKKVRQGKLVDTGKWLVFYAGKVYELEA